MHSQTLTFHWPLTVMDHGMFVLLGLLIYLTSTRMSRQHRHPSAAIAWVLIIALLPYLGIPLYLLFGVRKIPRRHTRTRQWQRTTAGPSFHWAFGLTEALGLPAPTRNEGVDFHADGPQALEALLALIDGARHSLDVCTFVLGDDEVAMKLCLALGRASARGVKVRVLADQVGSWSLPRAVVRKLRKDGVALRLFMPVLHNIRRGRVNLRNHRKLAIADGWAVWSGGRNLAAEYFMPREHAAAWTDISFVATGPLAQQAEVLFQQDWQVASGEIDYADMSMPVTPGPPEGPLLQWIPSGPDHADDTIYAVLLAAAYRAEHRIILVTPYFVPDDALLAAWGMACRRGVQVTLVIPACSNHRLADVARAPSLRALAQSGAHVMLHPCMLHAKAVIVDNDLALCGSGNLDARSLFLNYELTTAFYDRQHIEWLTRWADELIAESHAARIAPASAFKEMVEGLVRIVAFQL